MDDFLDEMQHNYIIIVYFCYKIRTENDEEDNGLNFYHGKWYNDAVKVAEKIGVEPSMPRVVRRQTLRANNPSSNPMVHYKVNLTIPFLDQVLSELTTR